MRELRTRVLSLALAMVPPLALAAPSGREVQLRGAAPAPERYAQAQDPRLLVLAAGIFDPVREELRHPLATLRAPGAGRYAVVQFETDAKADADWLVARGARVVGYVPNHAFLVEADADARAALAADARVRFVGAWRADYKIAPSVATADTDHVALGILLFRGEDPRSLLSTVAALTGDPLPGVIAGAAFPQLRVGVPRARLANAVAALAALDEVQWIERFEYPKLLNAAAVWPLQANQAAGANPVGNAPVWAQDILGSGQIVAIADSGMDRNEGWFNRYNAGGGVNTGITDADSPSPPMIGTLHPTRKVIGYFVQPGATAYDNDSTCPGGFATGFHGTHVSGTVAGDSATASTPTEPNYDTGDGMAPNAQILFQDLGNDTSGCLSGEGGLPMFQQARNAGAHISSNSYGSQYSGAYSGSDAEVDQAVWLNQDLLIAVAAGNDGPSGTTIGHPAHAKHALTVGALGSGNSTSTASFSSRGPTSDGRRKPDIMAPGTLTSALGNTNNANPPANPDQANTQTISGTSMATPAIAGTMALLRQYFTDGFYPSGVKTAANARKPLGAEMKALATNTTAFLSTTPGNATGWGRMWLDHSLYFPADARELRMFAREHDTGLASGEMHEYQVQVGAGQEFRATLAWFDPPGTPGAAGTALVNNLDLEVIEGANTYRGNVVGGTGASANSTTGGSADTLNPLEQVRLTAPAAGIYTIRVKGTAVPGDGQTGSNRQGYGLAVSMAQCPTLVTAAPAALSASNNGGAVDVNGGLLAGATSYQLYRADGSCAGAATSDFQLVAHGNGPTISDARTQGGYQYAYKMRGADACGEGPISACKDIVSTAPCTLSPSFNQATVTVTSQNPGACETRVQWSAGQSNCPAAPTLRYNVYRSTDPLFTPGPANRIATGISGNEYIDDTTLGLTTYHYVVRAEDSTSGNPGPSGGNESIGSVRVKHTPAAAAFVPGDFTDGADTPSFLTLGSPWSFSNNFASAGSFSYRNAPDAATNYSSDTCATLTSPVFNLPAGTSVLSFRARYNLEANWDGVVLEAAVDGGAFAPVAPDGGYPSSFSQTGSPPINACGYPASQGAFSGNTGGNFQTFTRSFTGATPRTVQLRWRFSSDPGSEEAGFYLDEVSFTNASRPAMCLGGNAIFNDGFEN
ncbi:MAG: S8 family serine peptidase [Xanthomonadales bacterium]|nr:hypothetical protein [Xanthomonadales bacterium]MCC6592458.1 S8 family serine peptidase [Xanthomonadales bacterium]